MLLNHNVHLLVQRKFPLTVRTYVRMYNKYALLLYSVSGYYCIVKASLMKTPIRRKRKKPASVLLDKSELLYFM